MAENIVTGRKYRILSDAANQIWDRISFWSKASDTEANDGETLEYKVGAINGITDALDSEDSSIAASSVAVKTLNDSLKNVSKNVYSTDEKVIGTWIDGKPLYRKVIEFSSFTVGSMVDHNIPNIDHVHLGTGTCAIRHDGWVLQNYYVNDADRFLQLTNKTQLHSTYGTSMNIAKFIFVVEYTKTTD